MSSGDPSSHRRRLKAELRRARDAAGLTQREVAEHLVWSLSKVIRIETGAVGISVTDLKAMLQLYGVTDKQLIKELSDAASGSKGPSWWSRYRDVLSLQFALYLGHEASASSIRVFHPFLIPGLLQTDEYALALVRVHHGLVEARRIVDLRMQRQKNLLGHAQSPHVAFIVGEEALYRQIGGPAARRQQLEHLRNFSNQTAEDLQILPFNAGAHPGLLGPFILLSFSGSAEDILFVEGINGDLVSRDDQDQIAKFTEYFEVMRGSALTSEDTKALLTQLATTSSREEPNPDEVLDPEAQPPAGNLDVTDAATLRADTKEDRWPPSRGVKNAAPHPKGTRPQLRASSTGLSVTGIPPCDLSPSSAAPSSSARLASPSGSACSSKPQKESGGFLPALPCQSDCSAEHRW